MEDKPQPPQTKRRLKDSCNSCGITKVKCNKAKPKCSRCEERGIFCHYSPSQRSGRRSAASTANAVPAVKPMLLPNDKVRTEKQQTSSPTKSIPFQTSRDSYSACSKTNTENHSPPQNIPQSLGQGCLEPFPIDDAAFDSTLVSPISFDTFEGGSIDFFDNLTGPPLLQTSQTDPFPTGFELGQSQPVTPLTPPISMYDIGQPSVPEPKAGIFENPHSCFTLALNILPMLHIPPSTCTTSSAASNGAHSSLYPTFDYVISTNKAIVEMINNIMNCSCSLDEQLASILSLIAFKLMAWYSAAAKEVDGEAANDGSSTSSERVLHLPVMVGRYKLDGDDARWLRAQLILSELQRMARLVNLLSKKFEEVQIHNTISRSNDLESRSRGRYISPSIFDQLDTDLKNRLQAVTEETTSILRGSQERG